MQDPTTMHATACSSQSVAAQHNPGLAADAQIENAASCGTTDDPSLPTSRPIARAPDAAPAAITVDTYAALYESAGMETPTTASASAGGMGDATAPDSAPAEAALQPLRFRIWERFCAGESRSAIARAFHIDRQTVTRHIHAVEALLAEEHQLEASIALWRAIEDQLNVQSTALDAYHAETAREDQAFAERDHNAAPRVHYRAQRARLLTIACSAAWNVARLQGLRNRPAPASAAESTPAPPPA